MNRDLPPIMPYEHLAELQRASEENLIVSAERFYFWIQFFVVGLPSAFIAEEVLSYVWANPDSTPHISMCLQLALMSCVAMTFAHRARDANQRWLSMYTLYTESIGMKPLPVYLSFAGTCDKAVSFHRWFNALMVVRIGIILLLEH